jgi:hypothetical protein
VSELRVEESVGSACGSAEGELNVDGARVVADVDVDVKEASADDDCVGGSSEVVKVAVGLEAVEELAPSSSSPPPRLRRRSRVNEPASRCCSMADAESGGGGETPKAQTSD